MFDVIALGRWARTQVTCTWTPSTFAPPSETRALIERAWAAALARPNVHLFDGPMCRMEGLIIGEATLELRLSPSSYKAFMGTNMTHPELPMRADPVGLSVALESADGFLMLGRRNDRVAYYPSRIHPFAGAMEPAENVDAFADALRELDEELSLVETDIAQITLGGVVADRRLRQPELIFLAKTTRTGAELEARLDLVEHASIVAIPLNRLEAELADVSQWTPVGVAAALLWGRDRLGDEWFSRRLPALAQ